MREERGISQSELEDSVPCSLRPCKRVTRQIGANCFHHAVFCHSKKLANHPLPLSPSYFMDTLMINELSIFYEALSSSMLMQNVISIFIIMGVPMSV